MYFGAATDEAYPRVRNGSEPTPPMRRTSTFFLLLAATLASLALFGGVASPASANAICAPTGNETVQTDQPNYPGGSVVHISGTGYASGCDVAVRVTRPDGSIVTGDGTETPG